MPDSLVKKPSYVSIYCITCFILLLPRFKEPVSIQHLVKACGQPMLICPVTPEMQLPDEFANHDLSDETKVSFLLMCTSREAIFKAETLGYEVVKMLRQKITILHQISEISRKLKETNSTKVMLSYYGTPLPIGSLL